MSPEFKVNDRVHDGGLIGTITEIATWPENGHRYAVIEADDGKRHWRYFGEIDGKFLIEEGKQ